MNCLGDGNESKLVDGVLHLGRESKVVDALLNLSSPGGSWKPSGSWHGMKLASGHADFAKVTSGFWLINA